MTELQGKSKRRRPKASRLILLWFLLVVTGAAGASETPFPRETPVVRAVRKAGPAVVNISSEYRLRQRSDPFSGFAFDPFFDSFFRDFFERRLERPKRESLGSGVIIDGRRGFILTNAHVVAMGGKIMVTLQDERQFEAEIVGSDPAFDLAVLRIESADPLPSISMGRSDDLMIGETVVAIGNPFGFSHTVTTGVVSAVNRSIRTDDRVYHAFIQIDASINPGNSGGPLLNINGELVGINTAIYAKAQGIGFAIPIDKARKIVSDLIRHGEVSHAWIGVIVQDLTAGMARYRNFPGSQGVVARKVHRGGPAHKAGIRDGDIIVSVGGKTVGSVRQYRDRINGYASGERLVFKIWRKGGFQHFAVTSETFPAAMAMELSWELLGIRVKTLTPQSSHYENTPAPEGVVISEIDPDAYLYRIGVRVGDVLRQIDGADLRNAEDYEKAVIKSRGKASVVVVLQRGKRRYYVTVEL